VNSHDEFQLAEWLRMGIAAARAGRRDEARELLLRVVETNERNEQAWLWLSGVVDSDEDRLICLENVLTLNPQSVPARSGIKWLNDRDIGGVSAEVQPDTDLSGTSTESAIVPRREGASKSGPVEEVTQPFLTPDGCVYCGLRVTERQARCPHCGGRIITKQFKKEERSPTGYLLHAYWLILAGMNLASFFLIGYVWQNQNQIPALIQDYLFLGVGPVVLGQRTVQGVLEPETMTQFVRAMLLGLAVASVLVALGLFLRRPSAHILGLVLVSLQLLLGVALFILGYLGYVTAAFQTLYTVVLTIFMFNTVDDFSQEERREMLQMDRRLVNDVDYFTRGRAFEKRGMWAKALLHWKRAATLNPSRDTYFAALARAYTQLGRYDEALFEMDSAMRVSRTPEMWRSLRDVITQAQRNANASSGSS
jgi:tetratricopeptide (TPR) repeat protein